MHKIIIIIIQGYIMTINKFDDISNLFNGSDIAFDLKVSNVPVTLPTDRDLDIKVGGVSLYENTDYTITGSSITFSVAPLAGDLFAGEFVDLNTYVDTSIANLVGSAPDTLNTLSELADALGDNENFSTTITDAVALKADQTDLDTTNGNVSTNTTAITNLTVNKADQTDLDNLDANKVSKSGDTMSGNLDVSGDITLVTIIKLYLVLVQTYRFIMMEVIVL